MAVKNLGLEEVLMRFSGKVCSFKIRSKGYKRKTAVHPVKTSEKKEEKQQAVQ